MAHVRVETEDVVLVRRERRIVRWLLIGFASIFALGLLSWGIYTTYPRWQERRLATKAQRLFESGMNRDAILTAQRTLQRNPGNIEATRLIAKILEKENVYESLAWWQRLAAVDPGNPDDAIALAASALKYQTPWTAAKALARVNEAGRATAAYHSTSAAVALAQNHLDDALSEAAEAVRIEPANDKYKLDLAIVQLRSPDAKLQETARKTLEALRESKTARLPALRVLVNRANASRDMKNAVSFSRELAGDPSSTFQDQLLHLGTLRYAGQSEFVSTLSALQQRVLSNPDELFALLTWMNENNQALTAIHWSKTLPAETLASPRIAATLAQCHANVGDWPQLKAILADAKWGGLDFIRSALLARVQREEGDFISSRNQWNLAMRAASQRDVAMASLQRLVASWGWERESEEALWASANGALMPASALQILAQKYQSRGDTRNLLRVFQRWYEVDSSRPDVKNNLALLSLLLRVNLIDAYVKAWELYSSNPRAHIFAATFAYSLHMQGFNKDGLRVLASLGEEPLHDPAIAAYCAVLLVANGALDQARPFIEVAEKATLLPEERALLIDAKQKVEVRESTKKHEF